MKGAYGISGYDGAGQTVAIIDAYASPTILQDVNQWSTNRGLPRMNPSQLVQVVPPGIYNKPQNPKQDPQGWYGEETLDVEAVHGMAPAARIVYVGAPNDYQDLDAAMNHVVDQHLAQIVTNSYGFSTELLPPGHVKPFEDTLIYDVLSVKTAVARRNFVNDVDATAGTVDRLRTLDDYSGSPSQHTNPGWDDVTGLGTPGAAFLATLGQ